MKLRKAAVAGMFYEREAPALRAQVDRCFAGAGSSSRERRWIAAVVPHAGLMYSGAVAAALYARVEMPQRALLLGPNHTGMGRGVAVDPHDAWETPFGPVEIDGALRRELLAESPLFEPDAEAHRYEHSLEVQLPLLGTAVGVVPVCIGDRSYATCEAAGEALARLISRQGQPVAIIASSDLNHYEDQQTTLRKDATAIDAILALDPQGLYRAVRDLGISMCGILPVTAALVASRQLGASEATLVKHATSGDVSGEMESVVGYASILIR
jgi:MEMO1 family protein